jgi:hypothetical protein
MSANRIKELACVAMVLEKRNALIAQPDSRKLPWDGPRRARRQTIEPLAVIGTDFLPIDRRQLRMLPEKDMRDERVPKYLGCLDSLKWERNESLRRVESITRCNRVLLIKGSVGRQIDDRC